MKKGNTQRGLLTVAAVCAALALVAATFITAHAQKPSDFDKERGRMMLSVIKDDLKKNYYDPNFHGMDIEARFKIADEKIKQAQSLGQIFGIIGQVLVDLEDSHTFFVPPGRSNKTEYGWQMQVIGEKAYVTAVKPGSDAAAKGLQEGDEVFSIDGLAPVRETLWKINYMYRALRPQPGMRLEIIKPDGMQQELVVLAKVREGKRVMDLTGSDIFELIRESETESRLHRHRYVELGEDVLVWKMPQFDMPKDKVDDFAGKFRKKKGLILDLRGNHGGYEETLLRLIGNVIDHDVTLGELKRRKDSKSLIAKTRGGSDAFTGKLIVLIDSESGSAAEIFARVIQLENRGSIIGDRSAGAVMRGKEYPHQIGIDIVAFYGVSITDADIIMSDGKSLERVGVTPDEIKLPTAVDLAARRDPVLAYAASLLGVEITPEKAGALFPIEWNR